MLITCKDCPNPYACSDMGECNKDTLHNSIHAQAHLAAKAKIIWTRIYPERTPWDNLTEETKKEWLRFVAVARDVLTL